MPMHARQLTTSRARAHRHTKITAGGRIFSFSALVVVGDGNGTAGFGYGKALSGGAAVQKATRDAEKRMFLARWLARIGRDRSPRALQ